MTPATETRTSPSKGRPKGRPKLDQAEDRLEAILTAATEVFLERGYSGASTREIARTAGASKETLYGRFPTKASLFAALIERQSDVLLASIADAPLVETDPQGALTAFAERVLGVMMLRETQRLYLVVVAEARDFPELAAAFWDKGPGRSREVIKLYLNELVKRNRMRQEDVEFASEQFLGALLGAVVLRSTLAIPDFLPDEGAMKTWARKTVEAFLEAHLIKEETSVNLRAGRVHFG